MENKSVMWRNFRLNIKIVVLVDNLYILVEKIVLLFWKKIPFCVEKNLVDFLPL